MKKLLSVVLSAVVLLASVLTVSAASVEAEAINVTTNAYTVTVKVDVPETVSGTMTVQIINAEKNILYAMDYSATRMGEGEDCYYQFELKMPASALTASDYIVRVGNNVKKQEQSFTYTNIEDKISFYNGFINVVATNGADGIKGYLNDPATKAPVELAAYNDLSDGVVALVNAKLAAVSGLQSLELTDSVEEQQKIDVVVANDAVFIPAFDAAMEIALIADVSEEDWEEVAQNAIEAGNFDNEYYVVLRDGTEDADEANDEIIINVADVYQAFKAEAAAVTALDLAEYQKAFDKATLKTIADKLDYASVKDAFIYYNAKGVITPDMTNITALVNANKDADLWKNVKTSGYTDAASLAANAEAIALKMINDGALVITPIGGGIAGGSSTTDRPSNPGSSMGIVSKPDYEPAEPVNPTQPKPSVGFADLDKAEWSREAVEYLAKEGVISGRDAKTFAPNDAVTREEGAKIIISAFDLLKDAECDFADVSKDRWSYAYIAAAAEMGLINGYGDEFGPTDTMTREQAATIIFRAAEYIKLQLDDKKTDFTDAEDAETWSRDAIANLAANGVINGMGDGTFAPKATLTRAQLAQLVYNVLVIIGGVN